ncbi:11904_t:CDS:2 [Ambispora gerdemannii]|uniref:11904_t:CDS:1 n=1 Tax=Ambispora gerdemannii TaxID=144530 RepID=A0A9N9ANK0_9GLOM|nr:11904_t:CDS:2 [Ambispora gerdemannii]
MGRVGVYYVDSTEQNKGLIELILTSEYVLVHRWRASGKYTRVWTAIEQLDALGYREFKGISFKDEECFWNTLGRTFRRELLDQYGSKKKR